MKKKTRPLTAQFLALNLGREDIEEVLSILSEVSPGPGNVTLSDRENEYDEIGEFVGTAGSRPWYLQLSAKGPEISFVVDRARNEFACTLYATAPEAEAAFYRIKALLERRRRLLAIIGRPEFAILGLVLWVVGISPLTNAPFGNWSYLFLLGVFVPLLARAGPLYKIDLAPRKERRSFWERYEGHIVGAILTLAATAFAYYVLGISPP